MPTTPRRPSLLPATPVDEFLNYYWLKQELVAFCRRHQLPTTGDKGALTDRIAQWLQTGQLPRKPAGGRLIAGSATAPGVVTLDAPITEHYTSGTQVRTFFRSVIGPHFRFTVGLMTFCRENPTKPFREAVRYWQEEHERKKDKAYRSAIAPQFEYNQYIRDFKADNPGASLTAAIACWKRKRNRPGGNTYCREDLRMDSSQHE